MSGKAIRETLGFIGLIASLVFVGMEIRQNTAVARAQSRQGLTENYLEYNMTLAADADLFDLHYRMWVLEDVLEEADQARARRTMFTSLRMLENVFLQVDDGVVDESVFQSYGWVDRDDFRTGVFRDWWGQSRNRFNLDFVATFEAEYDLAP